jgi:CheY-like chemotaxis protein
MKILVFENEIPAVSEAFKDVNVLDFGNQLDLLYIDKSQNFRDLRQIHNYDLVFVDIDLSSNSEKDGYEIIRDLLQQNYNKIVILTGHNVKSELQSREWEFLDVISKPIILDDLKIMIQKYYV